LSLFYFTIFKQFSTTMATAQPLMVNPEANSREQATEMLWQTAVGQLRQADSQILLPGNITELIGLNNITKIKARMW
jgi:hypothetical protein